MRDWSPRSLRQQVDIDNKANLLYLKIDTRRCFDNRDWVIVPKPTHSEPASVYAVHILTNDRPAAEFHRLFHNRQILYLQDSSKPYLSARFAWAILQGVKPFLLAGVPRNIIRVKVDDKEGTCTWETELVSAEVLEDQYGGGGSKGATPRKKRSRITSAADSEAEEEEEEEDESSTITPLDPVELRIRLESVKKRTGEE